MNRYEDHSAHHRLQVIDGGGVRLLRFERNQQSSMLLDDPFETTIEYVGYLHVALAVAPHASRTLMIGLGGGSLAKRFWRDYTPMRIDAVEIDPDVVDLAYELFALPRDERLRVVVGDGRAFLETCAESYDIIVIDAFNDDRVPRHLTTEEFMRAARDRLAPGGVLAYNVIGSVYGPHSKQFRSLHRTARNVWRHVWSLPVGIAEDAREQTRNIIMLASDADLGDDDLAARIATRVDGRVSVPGFERIADDLYRGKVRTGDVPLLLDPHRRSGRQGR